MQQQLQGKKQINNLLKSKLNFTLRVGKLLGKGGFGKCYQAELVKNNSQQKKMYALKVINKQNVLSNKAIQYRLRQEIFIHQKISEQFCKNYHQNIPNWQKRILKLYNVIEDETRIYLIMELCQKKNLDLLLSERKSKRLSEFEIKLVMRQIFQGVAFLHYFNILHRDLKPANILFKSNQQQHQVSIKISDFGLSRTLKKNLYQKYIPVHSRCGSPNYVSPQLLNTQGQLFPSDIWALGVIMYQLAFFKPPFYQPTNKETYHYIKNSKYEYPTQESPDQYKQLKVIIDSILKCQNQNKRPSIQQLLNHPYFQVDKCVIGKHILFVENGQQPYHYESKKLLFNGENEPQNSQEYQVINGEKKALLLINSNLLEYKINQNEIHVQYFYILEVNFKKGQEPPKKDQETPKKDQEDQEPYKKDEKPTKKDNLQKVRFCKYLLTNGVFGISYVDGSGIIEMQNVYHKINHKGEVSECLPKEIQNSYISLLISTHSYLWKKEIKLLRKYSQQMKATYNKPCFITKWGQRKDFNYLFLENGVQQFKFNDGSVIVISKQYNNLGYISAKKQYKSKSIDDVITKSERWWELERKLRGLKPHIKKQFVQQVPQRKQIQNIQNNNSNKIQFSQNSQQMHQFQSNNGGNNLSNIVQQPRLKKQQKKYNQNINPQKKFINQQN